MEFLASTLSFTPADIDLLSPIIAACLSSFMTVTVLKTDMKWIKEILEKHEEKISKIEEKISWKK